jgi:YegS/Rv2252/BmrU family lipid kinase
MSARAEETPADAPAAERTPPARVALLVNRRARRGDDAFDEARERLAAAGLALHYTAAPCDPAALSQALDEALAAGVDAIVVGGGDGTVASVAGRLAYRDETLGVLPLGTANSFARSIGIPQDVAGAVATIAAGHRRRVDLGRVGDRTFANSAAIGLPAQVADGDLSDLKRRFGRAGYLLGGLPRFLAHRPFRARIVVDGETHAFDALEIVVANGRFHGGVLVTWQAHVDSRDLVARVVKGESPWRLAHAWLRSAIGRPAGHDVAQLVRFGRARIETDPPQPVAVDGELLAHTPVDCSVAAGALAVYAPPDAKA